MLRFNAEKTFKIIYYILEHPEFTQLEISRKTKVSFGRVNKVVQWLVNQKLVGKAGKKYKLMAAIGIIQLLARDNLLEKSLTLELDLPREKLINHLKKQKNLVFCLTSALDQFDSYFRDPSINIYTSNQELINELKKESPGTTRINIYKPSQPAKGNTVKKNGFTVTTPIRTIIDLFAAGKAYAAERLIQRTW